MKKLLVFLAILLCFVSIFASKSSISINVIPYGFDFVKQQGVKDPVGKSTFLMGGEVVFQTKLDKGFFVEAGIESTVTKLKTKDSSIKKAFANVVPFGGAGYKVDLGKVVALACHLDVVGDVRFINKDALFAFGFKTGTSIDFKFNDSIRLSAGCDGLFTFNDKLVGESSYINYTSMRILPLVGMTVSL